MRDTGNRISDPGKLIGVNGLSKRSLILSGRDASVVGPEDAFRVEISTTNSSGGRLGWVARLPVVS
jgi:hypothetical protein